jgi:hypothetical protein
MKRSVFVGPSLHGVTDRPADIEFLPPARQGDIFAAVKSGTTWIGLVDGFFGTCASVWHKEILYALSRGCLVWGAASMGAVRAAECHAFGMVPVGAIALAYARGEVLDDAEVALIHGPAEADYVPFTEPMVDVRATIRELAVKAVIEPDEAQSLLFAAGSLHFSVRTVEAVLQAGISATARRGDVAAFWETHRVRAKRRDALLLIESMDTDVPVEQGVDGWRLAGSPSLSSLVAGGRSDGG